MNNLLEPDIFIHANRYPKVYEILEAHLGHTIVLQEEQILLVEGRDELDEDRLNTHKSILLRCQDCTNPVLGFDK